MSEELTDDEIQQQLSGNGTNGELHFKGKPLSRLTLGLRDLIFKVVEQDDTADFLHATTLYILAGAHGEDDKVRLIKRRALIAATDDRLGYRAEVSMFLDTVTEEERPVMKELWDSTFGIVQKAEVTIAPGQKKTDTDQEAASPTERP